MKILLISPPQIFLQSVGKPFLFQPTGLAYVAGMLEKEHDVHILDACAEGHGGVKTVDGKYYLGLPFDEIAERIKTVKPDIVGVSIVFSVNEYAGLKTVSTVKSVDKKIITVVGGPHPSVRPLETLSHPDVDYIVINEGEYTCLELFDKIERNSINELGSVCGIGYKINDKPILTQPRKLIENLDDIPFPARHLLPMELYYNTNNLHIKARSLYNVTVEKTANRNTTLISSRGCPYTCSFCSIHLTMGRKFRKRSAENVVAEIEEVISKYNIQHIDFEDDNLTFDIERAKRICDLIVEKNLKITWSTPNGIRADVLDEDLIMRMKKSGCVRIFIAPEAGSQDVIKNILNKNISLDKISEIVRLFKKYDIIVDASFVLGSIGKNGRSETKREIFQTIRYALKLKKLGMDTAGFNIAIPLFGTKMREYAEAHQYLKFTDDADDSNKGNPILETPEFTNRELRIIKKLAAWLVNYSIKERISLIWKHRNEIGSIFPYLKHIPIMCIKSCKNMLNKHSKNIQDGT